MKKAITTYIGGLLGLMAMLFVAAGCAQNGTSEPTNGANSFMTATLLGSPTINTGMEDHVESVAMLVFPTGAAGINGYAYVSTTTGGDPTKVPATKVKKGQNDIYFFANIPESKVKNITVRHEAEALLYAVESYTATNAQGATEPTSFPMARVYMRQDIGDGTQTNPFVFRPNEMAKPFPLSPVSRFSLAQLKTQDPTDKVGLVRSVAKVKVILSGPGKEAIAKAECYNVATNYSLGQLSDGASYPLQSTPLELSFVDETVTGTRVATIYIPEKLLAAGATWATHKNQITYLKLTSTLGRELEIPIINNGENAIPTGKTYIDVATGSTAVTPDYQIVRNMEYRFNVNVKDDYKAMDVNLRVMPWTLMESEKSFARPQFTIKIIDENGKVIPSGTSATQPDLDKEVLLQDIDKGVKIEFTISQPVGAVWVATITNGKDFYFVDRTSATGVVEDQFGLVYGTKTYVMELKPRNPFANEPRYTEFFITIDGKELFLGDTGVDAQGKPLGPRFMGEGYKGRWKFKQVML